MGRHGTIAGRKEKQDAKRSQIFTKYARAIAVAAKGGGDMEYNIALKNAVEKAKAINMPNDNINRAIKKGTGEDGGSNYEQITYEGYGPGGIAMIIDVLTDNKNRAAGNVRYYLDRNGGNLGTAGSVSYMFERKGQILIAADDSVNEDELMEAALEAGAEDFQAEEDGYAIITAPNDFAAVREALEGKYEFVQADITMLPNMYTALDPALQKQMDKLMDQLEEDDDVQNVWTNMQM